MLDMFETSVDVSFRLALLAAPTILAVCLELIMNKWWNGNTRQQNLFPETSWQEIRDLPILKCNNSISGQVPTAIRLFFPPLSFFTLLSWRAVGTGTSLQVYASVIGICCRRLWPRLGSLPTLWVREAHSKWMGGANWERKCGGRWSSWLLYNTKVTVGHLVFNKV